MIKIALVNTSDFLRTDSFPSLGIGCIKAFIQHKIKKGLSVKIFRLKIIHNIEKFKPDILGISSENINYPDAINLAKIIKQKLPKTLIVIGGPHITVLPRSLDPVFDFGIVGEGEETFFELLSLYKQKRLMVNFLKKVNGLIFYINKKIFITKARNLIEDVNNLPHVNRKDFDSKEYSYVLCSRGCVYDCPYCSSTTVWGPRKLRLYSAEYMISEFKALIKLGYKNIRIEDEMYCISIDRLKKILDLLKIDRKIFNESITFEVILTTNIVSKEICDILEEMNVKKIKIGLYSGSKEILVKNRNTDIKTTLAALGILRSSKIEIEPTFTINSPKERKRDLRLTYRFIKDNQIKKFRLIINRPYPGTQNWNWALKNRLIKSDFNFRILDHEQTIEQVNAINFINLTNEKIDNLIYWGVLIESLKDEVESLDNFLYKKYLSYKKYLFAKIKNINMDKIFIKMNRIFYDVGLTNELEFPKNILLNINNSCNLNCIFCLVRSSRISRKNDKDMSLGEVVKIIPELVKFHSNINISGGEPLLNKEVFEIIYFLRKNGIRTNLSTNGYFIKKYFAELILSKLDMISLSMDHSSSEIHDEIRGVKGAFGNLMEGMTLLGGLNNKDTTKININTVINKSNYKDLSDIYDFIENLGYINSWQLRHLTFNSENNYQLQIDQLKNSTFPVNDVIGTINNDKYFSKAELVVLVNQLNEIKAKSSIYKTKLTISPDNVNVGKYYSDYVFKKSKCKGPFEELTIWNDDILTKCGYKLGKLDKVGSLYDVWQGRENKKFKKFIDKNRLPRCFRCIRANFQ